MKNGSCWCLAAVVLGCGGTDGWEPGPSVREFEYVLASSAPVNPLIVLVIDDRPSMAAATLRSGIGASVRRFAWDALQNSGGPDPTSWHRVDVQVVIVPATSTSANSVMSPVNDAALRWATLQATTDGADALGAAVNASVRSLATAAPGPFHPLERARDMLQLLTASRPPLDDAELRLAAVIDARPSRSIGVAIIAASDDESPEPAVSYWGSTSADFVVGGLVTPERIARASAEKTAFPRLTAWIDGRDNSPVSGCFDGPATTFFLFQQRLCVDYRPYCDGRPVEQSSPGLGVCNIEVSTFGSDGCIPSRGWLDPVDADGVRRPRKEASGANVCEVQPVDPSVMDSCIHDPECSGCGSGWCVTQVFDELHLCPPGSMLRPIRWVGGALPDHGTVHVRCREPSP